LGLGGGVGGVIGGMGGVVGGVGCWKVVALPRQNNIFCMKYLFCLGKTGVSQGQGEVLSKNMLKTLPGDYFPSPTLK